ncbi:MAG: CXXX repeat peptide modification system protein [Clostridium sp.]|uniref:CXXX repeat peptide modification system protein n=1 Tax=Clostridium sp. TaxID=1506 RepID=UPI003D6D4C38
MKKIGFVMENEKNQILTLYERKLALEELEETLINNDLSIITKSLLINKVKIDKEKTHEKFNRWWISKNIKYKWISNEDMSMLSIDFRANEIFIVE